MSKGDRIVNRESGQRVWLIISYWFNLDGNAASQTITDKLPQLAKQGITPVIISAATGQQDPVWEHYRQLSPAPSGLRFELRHIINRTVPYAWLRHLLKAGFTLLIVPFYLLEKIFLPLHSQWSWFIPAYWRGLKLIRKHHPELIYATGGPDSAFLASHLLAKKTGTPWIAEIHDPMVTEPNQPNQRKPLSQRWAAWLEGLICTHASAAFWFTAKALSKAQDRNPQLAQRGHTILPGVTPPDFGKIGYQPGPRIHFAHFGSLSKTRNLEVFFAALAKAITQNEKNRHLVQIDIYGNTMDFISRQAMITHNLSNLVQEKGKLRRQQVLEQMRKTDVLLLLHGTIPHCEEYIPSKIYEYFYTSRPILAAIHLNPQLDALLKERGHTPIAATDIEGLQQAIIHLIESWQRHKGLPDLPNPQPLSVSQTVDTMIAIINKDLSA